MKIIRKPFMLATALCALLAVQSVDAQSRKGARRTSLSKKELEDRYKNLREEIPAISSARDASRDESEDVKRRAFAVVDKALNRELDLEIAKEQTRLAAEDGDVIDHIRESEKALKNAREILPSSDAKRFDAANRSVLVSAFSGQDSVSGDEKDGPDFDGFTALTPEGETFKVPGVDDVKSFDGKVVPVEGNGPEPGPKPGPVQPKKKKGDAEVTEITCSGQAVFSSTGSEEELKEGEKPGPPIVIFKENVHVKHPEFTIDCDHLISYMDNDDGKGKAGDAESGGIKRVVATGREVVVRKKMADGKVKIGKARKLTYNKDTGDVILEDWPQVQDGANIQMAARKDVVMVIKADGRMVATGPTKAVIVPKTGEDSPLPGQ